MAKKRIFFAVLAVALARILPATDTWAQERPSTFAVCLGYVSAVDELETKFSAHQTAGSKLITERQETLARLLQTKASVEQLMSEQAMGSLALLQTELVAASMQSELSGLLSVQRPFDPQVIDVRYDPQTTFRQFTNQVPVASQVRDLGQQITNAQVQIDAIVHELKTVNMAGRLAVERYTSLVMELAKIANEMGVWQSKSVALFNQYWELSDVAGVRSDLELRTALRQMEQASDANGGAAFARAITLMRLDRYEEALPLLNSLSEVPAVHAIAVAARGELLWRMGEKHRATLDLRQALKVGQADARVRMHRAQAFSAGGDFRQAEAEWEAVLKLGGHEIPARRATAFINASYPAPHDRNKAKAADNALLASQLAGDDWACEVALALAAAANGQTDKGVESAKRAAELAIGANQLFCDDLAQRIDAGIPVSWKF